MEKISLVILRAEGAVARAAGATILDNPFYRTENLPSDNEDDFARWEAQALAWESGWHDGLPVPQRTRH